MKDHFPSGNRKRVKMRDVAARCGVSISTVSLVLSGDPRIPEDTTRKVLQTVKALEYRPNIIARNLARKGSRTVGIILPEWAFVRNQSYFYEILQGIHGQTQPAGFKMMVEAANKRFLERRYYLRILKEQSADGVIYLAAHVEDSFLSDMLREESPFALLVGSVDDSGLPTFGIDEAAASALATGHLLKLGHKLIGFMGGLPNYSLGRDREQGYRKAITTAGAVVNSDLIVHGNFDAKEAEEATLTLINNKATAIVVAGDQMALGVYRALHKAGLKIPGDCAVVGMDDLLHSAWMIPALTSVKTHVREIAEMATSYVLRGIQTPANARQPLGEKPLPQLIIRESCGA